MAWDGHGLKKLGGRGTQAGREGRYHFPEARHIKDKGVDNSKFYCRYDQHP